jgi:hypothetical protein
MTIERVIEIIQAARNRGDRYAGRFASFAAEEIAKVEGCENTGAIYSIACKALAKLDEGKSLMDAVKMTL